MAVQMEKGIPLSALNPKFLHSNSTSHTWPFSAVAELIDNAYDPDVKAKQFWIDKTLIKDQICLTFVDNGGGMDYDKMYKMLSFGFSDKKTINGHAPVGLYGNGFKSGSMRLGKDTIVFSKNGDSMCVGMLSQTYLEDIKAENIIVPIVAFRCTRQSIQPESQHTASLQAILHYSLFQTEKELLAELNAINSHSGSTGTRIIIWNLRKTKAEISEFDFDVDRYDIQIPADVYEKEKYKQPCRALQSSPESDFSLRAYCSILYLKPRMQIIIRGQKVKTELISKSLAHINKDKYKPVFLNKETIPITFGYNTKSKEHYGVMMYHKNRLIKAYERVGCQNKANDKGVGVIAVIECNFLKPTHNKQDFDYTEEYRKTLLTLGVKLEEYWRAICFKKGPNSTVPVEDMPKRPDQNWVQCDECLKWRKLPDCIDPSKLPEKWFCLQNPDPQYRRCDVPEEAEDSEDEAAADLKIFKQHERNLRQQEKQQEQKRFEGLPTLTAAVTASSPLNFRLRSQAASSPSESLPVISDVMSLSTPKRLKRNLKSLTPNQAVKKVRTANACSSNTLNSPSTSTATPNVLSMVIPKNCDDDVIIVEINSTPKPKKLDFDLSKVKPERRTSDDVPGLHMECSDHASIETPVTEDTRTTTPTSTSSITQTESNIALKVEEDKQKQKEGKGEDRDNGPITMEQSGISVKRRIDKEMEINRLIEEPMEYMTCRSIDGENRPALTEDERMSSIPVKNYVFKSQERTDSGEKSSQRYPDSNANLDKGDKEGTSAASKSSNFHSLAHIPTTEAQQQQDNLMDLLDSTARERDEWREHAMLLSLKLEKQNIKLMELTVKREHSDQSAQTDPSDELDYKTLYLQATQQIEELRRERDGLKTNEEKMLQMKAEKEAHDKVCSDRMKAPGEGTSEIINAHESVDDEMALQLDFLLREMDQRNQLCGELKEKLESLEEERNGLLRQLKQIQKDMEQLRKETEEQRKTLGEQGTQTDFQCVNQVQVRQSSTQTSSTEDGTTSQASLVNQEDDASERREENSAIPAKLRELRVSVARLLVTFVPALDLEQVNYDCDVIDEILDQVLREISPPLTISN